MGAGRVAGPRDSRKVAATLPAVPAVGRVSVIEPTESPGGALAAGPEGGYPDARNVPLAARSPDALHRSVTFSSSAP